MMRAISQFAFILCLLLPTYELFSQLSSDVVVRESLMISVKNHDEMNLFDCFIFFTAGKGSIP